MQLNLTGLGGRSGHPSTIGVFEEKPPVGTPVQIYDFRHKELRTVRLSDIELTGDSWIATLEPA